MEGMSKADLEAMGIQNLQNQGWTDEQINEYMSTPQPQYRAGATLTAAGFVGPMETMSQETFDAGQAMKYSPQGIQITQASQGYEDLKPWFNAYFTGNTSATIPLRQYSYQDQAQPNFKVGQKALYP